MKLLLSKSMKLLIRSVPTDTMTQGKSVLNPYATPYIPLSKIFPGTCLEGEIKPPGIISSDCGNKVDVVDSASYQLPGIISKEYITQSAEKVCVSNALSSKVADQTDISDIDTSHDEIIVAEKQNSMDDLDIIMDSLSSMFPDISRDSLAELFKANHGDLSETIDMLEQLEFEDVGFEDIPEISKFDNNLDQKINSSGASSST